MAQILHKKLTEPPEKKELIYRATWVVKSGEKKFRIISSDSFMCHRIMSHFECKGLTNVSYTEKTDRFGEKYYERSFYFKKEDWERVMDFLGKIE